MADKNKKKNNKKKNNDKINSLKLQDFFLEVFDKIQELDDTVNGLLGHKIGILNEAQLMRQNIENLQVKCDCMKETIQKMQVNVPKKKITRSYTKVKSRKSK